MNPFSNNRNAMMHQQSYSAEPYREGMDFTDEAWAYGLRALPGSLANQLQALGEYTTGKDYPNKLSNYLDELTQVNEMGYTPQTKYEQAVAFLPELVYDPALIAGAPYAAYKGIRNAPKLLNTLSDDMLTTPMRNQIGAISDIPAPSWLVGKKSIPVGTDINKSEAKELLRDGNELRVLLVDGEPKYFWNANDALHADIGAYYGVPKNKAEHGLVAAEDLGIKPKRRGLLDDFR